MISFLDIMELTYSIPGPWMGVIFGAPILDQVEDSLKFENPLFV